ncbi:MAG: NAD(P)-dependent oxidoreductase, partial [Phycisphaerales bacterium]|nr:NAD(P)-dependent oxidoreductase [Phycisphaerales bacterium]
MSARAFIVTGACGYVGAATARALAGAGHEVVTLSLFETNIPGVALNKSGDLAEPDTLGGLNAPPDATVIHAAALMNTTDTNELWHANVEATRQLLEWSAMNRARRVVFLSTGGVYGYAKAVYHTETSPLDPVGFYGHTKRIGEQLCEAFASVSGFDATSLRLFFPFGPGQQRGVFSFIDRAVREGLSITINPGGAPRMNPIHIDDLVALITRAADPEAPPGVYNAAGPEDISFLEAVRLFEKAHGKQAVIAGEGSDEVLDML